MKWVGGENNFIGSSEPNIFQKRKSERDMPPHSIDELTKKVS